MNRWYFSAALELVIILSRHGIRSPLVPADGFAPYAAQAWPQWPVPPGALTAHGARQMVAMGHYFRDRYLHEGLLTGDSKSDAGRIEIRADTDERTIDSGEKLAEGLLPGQAIPVHHRPVDAGDPLFVPVRLDVGHPDRALAKAAILGRMGNDPTAVFAAHRAIYARLQHILYGDEAVGPGKKPPLTEPAGLGPGTNTNLVGLTGPLSQGLTMSDALLLEYAEGFPLDRVGWGRMSRADLSDLLSVHSLYFDYTQKTLYCAQAQGSNLARHLIETLDQAATHHPVPGAIGPSSDRLLIMMGHDTNIINLAGLLDLSWIIPGGAVDPVLPGCALVFELRRADDGVRRVRIYYVSQTLEEMRGDEPVDASHPPALAPIFIPGCSEASPGYDAPLDKFEERLERAIDSRFVVPGSD
jgi:4-phytase/acid phosphatase